MFVCKKLDFNFNEFSPDSVLNKKILACIVHVFLIQVLKEKDEEDWSAARILKNIVQNPYILGPDLQQNIVLYCTKGYQSTLAADVLTKAGYLNVFVISC